MIERGFRPFRHSELGFLWSFVIGGSFDIAKLSSIPTIPLMARLRDVPVVLRTVGPWAFLKRIVREILDDNLFTLAGGLAYSWLFALFPYLVFLMNLFPFFAGGREQETKDGMKVF